MKFLSEYEILDQYQIQEATLSHLQDLGMLPESESKRGKLVYPYSKNLDLTLRTAKAYFYEISDSSLRMLPCFRAFIALAISEGAKAAWSLMKRRGFFDRYEQKDLVLRWRRFKSALPKELIPFVTGKSDEVTPAVEKLLTILGVVTVFYAPEKLKIPEIYDHLMIQQDIDALLLAGAKSSAVTELIGKLHHVDIGANTVEVYREFYFNTTLLTGEDFAQHIRRFPPSSSYRKLLSIALLERSLVDFITKAQYPVRISLEEALSMMVTPMLKDMNTKVCGPLTEKTRADAVKNAVHIMETLEKHSIDDDVSEDEGDLLRLRHDIAANQNQLVASDIPEEDFDTAASSYRRDDEAEKDTGESA